MNHVNLENLQKTRRELEAGQIPATKAFEVEGRWLLEGPGQFQATLAYPGGQITLVSDQPPTSGGEGTAPNPVQYCVFAMLACYATTFVTLAAQEGVEIQDLRVRGASVANLRVMFGLEEGPVVEQAWIELRVKSPAPPEVLERLRQWADQKCPAAYSLQHQVPFTSRVERM